MSSTIPIPSNSVRFYCQISFIDVTPSLMQKVRELNIRFSVIDVGTFWTSARYYGDEDVWKWATTNTTYFNPDQPGEEGECLVYQTMETSISRHPLPCNTSQRFLCGKFHIHFIWFAYSAEKSSWNRQTNKQTHRQTNKKTDRKADRQTNTHTNKQSNKQTVKQEIKLNSQE